MNGLSVERFRKTKARQQWRIEEVHDLSHSALHKLDELKRLRLELRRPRITPLVNTESLASIFASVGTSRQPVWLNTWLRRYSSMSRRPRNQAGCGGMLNLSHGCQGIPRSCGGERAI